MIKVAVALALVACVFADEAYPDGKLEHPKQVPEADPKVVYKELGHKQLYVNKAAEHRGAGTGTAYYYGVPGTGVSGKGFPYRGDYGYGKHDDHYGYDNRGYGYDGYGYDGHHGAAPYAGSHHQGAYYNYGPYNDHFYGRGYGYGGHGPARKY